MTGTNRPAVGIYSSTSRKAWAFFLPEIIVFDMGGGLLEPSLGRGAALCARDQRAQSLLKSYKGGNAHPGRDRKLKPMGIAPNVLWEPQSEKFSAPCLYRCISCPVPRATRAQLAPGRQARARLCLSPAHSRVRGSLPGTWGPCGVFGHP